MGPSHPFCSKVTMIGHSFMKENNPEMSLEDVIAIVFNEHADNYVCKKQPIHFQENSFFLINTVAVRLQDLPADDNGMHIWTYQVQRNSGTSLEKALIAKNSLKLDKRRGCGKYYFDYQKDISQE